MSQLKMQADDFFDAYQVLRKHSDTISLTTSVPTVVNLALALELYIKYLHYALKDKHVRGHDILELFRRLPKEAQQEIKSHAAVREIINHYAMEIAPTYILLDKKGQPSADVLERKIYEISNAFTKWRYANEHRCLHYEESTALALIEAIKSATVTKAN